MYVRVYTKKKIFKLFFVQSQKQLVEQQDSLIPKTKTMFASRDILIFKYFKKNYGKKYLLLFV